MAIKKKLTSDQRSFVDLVYSKYGPNVSRKQILEVSKENGLSVQWWILSAAFKDYRSRRGLYNLDSILEADTALGGVAAVGVADSATA